MEATMCEICERQFQKLGHSKDDGAFIAAAKAIVANAELEPPPDGYKTAMANRVILDALGVANGGRRPYSSTDPLDGYAKALKEGRR